MASNPPGFMKPPHVPFLSSKMSEKGKLFKLQLRRRHTSGIEERPSRSKERLGEFLSFNFGFNGLDLKNQKLLIISLFVKLQNNRSVCNSLLFESYPITKRV
ncbi:hypothetical protein AVEN_240398-1 [Araneus ventricosus]|uniref:Uncharacterized protein n=1 Tax=Araneus ventricosus TaxID=182803 RepID=A0A4Y2R2R2_ARAVE|nr:hypothetical protein AVEN_240398-1 [Araneus ventricosus]